MSTDIPKSSESFDPSAAHTPSMAAQPDPQDPEALHLRAREVQQRLEEGFQQMEQRYGDLREQLHDYNERATEFIRENPALCLAGAVGVGFLLGKLAKRRWLV